MGTTAQQDRIEAFWARYRQVVADRGAAKKSIVWYEKRARDFVEHTPKLRLKDRTPDHVKAYLSRATSNPQLSPWQVDQVVDSVHWLYADLVPAPWADDFPWGDWKAVADTRTDSPPPPPDTTPSTPSAAFPEPFRDVAPAPDTKTRFTGLLQRLRRELRLRHYSIHTEQANESWVCRYLGFHGCREPEQLGAAAGKGYLEYLADKRAVAASTQNQALCALVFLYEQVLGTPLEEFRDFSRAKRPARLPTVLPVDETERLLDRLQDTHAMVAGLLYGSGLRIRDALRLRNKDIDFDYGQVVVRSGKGEKDRVTALPETSRQRLPEHLGRVRALFEADRKAGLAGVYIWPALERKYPAAGKKWHWRYVFPSPKTSQDPRTGAVRRQHLHDSKVQKAITGAAVGAGIPKHVTSHTLRHSFTRPIQGPHPPGVPLVRAIPRS